MNSYEAEAFGLLERASDTGDAAWDPYGSGSFRWPVPRLNMQLEHRISFHGGLKAVYIAA